mmetsp:Transcript_56885/g.144683  ORF Transcript_56885/g.144683 Transcript_56885/m.144683 type:complete len:81 (+) Transcript_56885:40-282(+)
MDMARPLFIKWSCIPSGTTMISCLGMKKMGQRFKPLDVWAERTQARLCCGSLGSEKSQIDAGSQQLKYCYVGQSSGAPLC